jgi:hypothetical protein
LTINTIARQFAEKRYLGEMVRAFSAMASVFTEGEAGVSDRDHEGVAIRFYDGPAVLVV